MNRGTRGPLIAGLDVGTTKTCAVLATAGEGGLEIVGVGEAPSQGLRRGVVTDLDQTVRSIEAAAERAERMAGMHISHVYVGVTGEHVASRNNRGVVAVSGEEREVVARDVRRVVEASKLIEVGADRQIIHALARTFSVDGHDGITDPVGMSGARLEVETHIVTGGSSFINNVLKCVHRAGLEPAGVVFEPLASSAATLCAEERHLGVALLDIGGGTTDLAVYAGGSVLHSATIPVGGNILTSDIALGLRTSFAEAEAIKHRYACAVVDDRGSPQFTVKTLDGTTQAVSATGLRAIVGPRIDELFRMVGAQLGEHLPRGTVLAEVVLTGGGAHLYGIERAAAAHFGVPARIGVPTAIGGLCDAVCKPEYATAVGLVLVGPSGDGATWQRTRAHRPLGALGAWLGDLWT